MATTSQFLTVSNRFYRILLSQLDVDFFFFFSYDSLDQTLFVSFKPVFIKFFKILLSPAEVDYIVSGSCKNRFCQSYRARSVQ